VGGERVEIECRALCATITTSKMAASRRLRGLLVTVTLVGLTGVILYARGLVGCEGRLARQSRTRLEVDGRFRVLQMRANPSPENISQFHLMEIRESIQKSRDRQCNETGERCPVGDYPLLPVKTSIHATDVLRPGYPPTI